MKRVCTKAEIELLNRNQTQIIGKNKRIKRFFKQHDLSVNGATIIDVNEVLGRFSYIEDGFVDESGKPIIVDFPICPDIIKSCDIGTRMILLYDGEYDFLLIKVNEELKGVVSEADSNYPFKEDMDSYTHVPHQNVLRINRKGHELTEQERNTFAKLHVDIVQSVSLKMAKFCVIFLFFIAIALCLLIANAEGGYPLEQTLPVAGAGYVGLLVLYGLMFCLGKKNLFRRGQFVSVQEVVFRSYAPEENVFTVFVYEWIEDKLQICEYEYIDTLLNGVDYGTVLYKCIDKKGKIYLQNTKVVV